VNQQTEGGVHQLCETDGSRRERDLDDDLTIARHG
jgi:hypothetical protein